MSYATDPDGFLSRVKLAALRMECNPPLTQAERREISGAKRIEHVVAVLDFGEDDRREVFERLVYTECQGIPTCDY
jgi:hypothetical protein